MKPHKTPNPSVSLDIDGVLCNVLDVILTELSEELGEPRPTDTTMLSYTNFETFFPHREQDLPSAISKVFARGSIFWAAKPYPGAAEFANKIPNLAGYITHRVLKWEDATKLWLKQNGFPTAPIIFSPRTDKSYDVKKLFSTVFLDDNPTVVSKALIAGIDAYLLDRPYNQDVSHFYNQTSIKRVDYDGFLKEIGVEP